MLTEELLKKKYKTVFIANDHAGLELKRHLVARFPVVPWQDLGTKTAESVDYPDYTQKLCHAMEPRLTESCGVLICGSGQGMAIGANRFPYIRAALCWDEEVARLAREHNDANVLCLAGRLTVFKTAERILEIFLNTDFLGGRHQTRVRKLS
jgi:ribose 5-phosphate isomerase B